MKPSNLVLVEQFCSNFNVEFAFIDSMDEFGIIQIVEMDHKKYINNLQIKDLERATHFYHDLNINVEGIEVIYNLIKQIDELQDELTATKEKLEYYLLLDN